MTEDDGGRGVTIHPCWVRRGSRVSYLSSLQVVAASRNLIRIPRFVIWCWGWGWRGVEQLVGRLLGIGCPVIGKSGNCI